jgi:hypothetical protein
MRIGSPAPVLPGWRTIVATPGRAGRQKSAVAIAADRAFDFEHHSIPDALAMVAPMTIERAIFMHT